MTTEEIVLKEILKNISGMSQEDQIRVLCIASTMRNIVKGEPLGSLALALVGAELAATP